jgi:hypothetical protein
VKSFSPLPGANQPGNKQSGKHLLIFAQKNHKISQKMLKSRIIEIAYLFFYKRFIEIFVRSPKIHTLFFFLDQ